jgi:hypothetical protein
MVDLVRRRRLLPLALVEGALLFGALTVAAALGGARVAPAPAVTAGVAARVVSCAVSGDAAQITYAVTNADPVPHGYRVELTVDNGPDRIGYGVSLLPRVEATATATARALVPTAVRGTAATCSAHATRFDGHAGHHGA